MRLSSPRNPFLDLIVELGLIHSLLGILVCLRLVGIVKSLFLYFVNITHNMHLLGPLTSLTLLFTTIVPSIVATPVEQSSNDAALEPRAGPGSPAAIIGNRQCSNPAQINLLNDPGINALAGCGWKMWAACTAIAGGACFLPCLDGGYVAIPIISVPSFFISSTFPANALYPTDLSIPSATVASPPWALWAAIPASKTASCNHPFRNSWSTSKIGSRRSCSRSIVSCQRPSLMFRKFR